MKQYNVAVVGATGMVGRTFLTILDELNFPIDNLYLYASKRSEGKQIEFRQSNYIVEELCGENIVNKNIDIAFFSAGGIISLEFAPIFSNNGALVIDNSSAWRMDDNIPLIVPEVNIETASDTGIIANPNCSTIQCVIPLKVLDDLYGIKHVRYSTYQSVSGSGLKGIRDLELTSKGQEPDNYPHPIYNNVLPHIDVFLENGYTKEEKKMIDETRKILNKPNLNVTATCVRVPVLNSHSVEINVELENGFTVEEVLEAFNDRDEIIVLDDPSNNIYPLATIASGTNEVYVGRIRRDLSRANSLHLFVVADNIRKGAATNAVQIALELINRGVI